MSVRGAIGAPVAGLVVILAVSGGTILEASAGGSTEGFDAKHCTLRVNTVRDGPRRVVFAVRCDFMATDLVIDASGRIRGYSRNLELTAPDPEDRPHRCKRTGSRQISCHGEAGEGVTMTGRLRVTARVCARPKLRLQAFVEGGEDCDEEGPCLLIRWRAQTHRKRPIGC